MAMTSVVLGIDLGTTNSCAAAMVDDLVVIPLEGDSFTMASVVAFPKNDEVRVGSVALRQAASLPERTVIAGKRLIGRSFDDPATQSAISHMSFRCVRGDQGDVRVAIDDRSLSLQEVSASVLGAIRAAARDHLGEAVDRAIVTVPAYFNDRQRSATKEAGAIAGLEVLQVLNEPTAAALAYGLDRGRERKVAVYDLGGGTFDVSILNVGENIVEVLASSGDAFLGGHDFDQRIIDWLLKGIQTRDGIDLGDNPEATERLRGAAEAAKIQLTDQTTTRIALPFIGEGNDGLPIHVDAELDRETFEGIVEDLVERTVDTLTATLGEADLCAADVEELVFVGGMTCMPRVRERIQEVVKTEPSTGVHPDLVVAVGAAIHGAAMVSSAQKTLLLDVTPHDLGIEIVAGMAQTIIPKNTKLPAQVERRFTTIRDNQSAVDVVICQGEGRTIEENQILGRFRLEGLNQAPAGQTAVDVRFEISKEGIVHVSALEVGGVSQESLRIDRPLGMSEEELERLKAEAQRHSES